MKMNNSKGGENFFLAICQSEIVQIVILGGSVSSRPLWLHPLIVYL